MALSREFKVGAFVLSGLIGAGTIVFLIGDNHSLFDSKVPFHAQFTDVQGVKPGSTVRMGGVDIGTVSRVQYASDTQKPLIEVEFNIVKREAQRIREGSEASIAAKGLLGDKMVSIVPGPPDRPPIPPGGLIASSSAEDFTQALSKVQGLVASANRVLENLKTATDAFAGEQFQADLQQGVGALSHILVAIDSGDGYVARLLHDGGEAKRLSSLLANLTETSARLDQVLASVDVAVDRVNRGPGLAHEVIYGESGSRALAQVGSAADEVGKTLAGIREGNSITHGLLYGPNGDGDSVLGDQLAGDLSSMSADLRAVLNGLREGKGTLGALLVDPSVYEDMKLLLGNVQRNQALRALVRYSIRRDDGAPGVEVVDPKSEAAEAEPAPAPHKGAAPAASRTSKAAQR